MLISGGRVLSDSRRPHERAAGDMAENAHGGQRVRHVRAVDGRIHVDGDRELPPRDDARRALNAALAGNGEADVDVLVVRDEVRGGLEVLNPTRHAGFWMGGHETARTAAEDHQDRRREQP